MPKSSKSLLRTLKRLSPSQAQTIIEVARIQVRSRRCQPAAPKASARMAEHKLTE